MTADRDLTLQLAAWLDDRATSTVPEGLLARSLARVEEVRQRPGWLAAQRRTRALRPAPLAFVPAWAIILVAILAALALVAVGSQVFFQPRPAIIAEASPLPSADASVAPEPTPEITADSGPLGGRLILAEIFKGREVEGPHDLVSIDARTGERVLLGSVPGSEKPIFSGAHPITFQRTPADEHTLISGGDSGQHVSQLTGAGRAFGFIASSEVPVDCCTSYGAEGLTLSPDGQRVAFLRVDRFDTPLEIVVLRLQDGTSTRVALPATSSGEVNWFGLLSWSPDGSAVLAYGCRPCNHAATPQERQTAHHAHLYVLPVDGAPIRELADVDNGSIFGSWSPDAATIVTATWHCAKGSYMPRCDPAEGDNSFGTIALATGTVSDIGNDPSDGTGLFELKVSPEGTRVAYRTNDGLFVRNVEVGTPPLKLAEGLADWPDWSPDGQWILFERGSAELWIVPSAGGDPRLIGTDLAGGAW